MAIRIIDGVPGSGKSYYAVKHLLDTYFKFDKEIEEYVLRKPITLISNVDGLLLEHVSLQDEIKDAGGVVNFFEESFQEQYRHRYESQIVYVIDEAQKMFRRNDRTLSPIFGYFEYHRHFGQDIYLITQNSRKIHADIVDLTEYIVRSAPRIRSIVGELKYKWISDGEVIKREGLKPNQKIFDVYKSQDSKESEKISNPVMKTVALVMCGVVLMLSLCGWYFSKIFYSHDTKNTPVSEAKSSNKSSTKAGSFYRYKIVDGVKQYTNI
ncbi:MAG: zonular occludens toxin domain-containing protein [Desulfotalea sp.]